ncbi:sigma-54-dependent transcriptional regulator [Aurantibacillus circumpalustris]|uniref:sigma-54-dependent transcriptional regulator n=1 Tax=Aurantibacillus circumpalustris TaxID=3036359 RepID=UPI00295AFD24|nr:sigma-54 dependent transcriptional regulator [Aurantibacillus circumpalustris]
MNLKQACILVIDDDRDVLTAIGLLLKKEVLEVVTEKNPENLLGLLKKQNFDLVLLDMNFNASINTGNEGIYWLKRIKEFHSDMCVIMITAYADIDLAIRSLKEGADDFIVKPWNNQKLTETIQDVLKKKGAEKKNNKQNFGEYGLIGESDVMRDIFSKIEKIAPTDANILILGENGTGKDLIAQAIHQRSLRANKSYVKVDVGSLTESLFESELFGHKKGAFTDAREDRAGRFEAADGGTLFLDEIGNISLHQQAKLLSVLQNRKVVRLGTNNEITINLRLICATNLPLTELANEDKFRKDLIYRINTVEIIVPPLRSRKGDIALLAKHFLKFYGNKYFKPKAEFHSKALEKLCDYRFPGNVRELQYSIERAVIMADSEQIQASDLIFSPIESGSKLISEEGNETKLSAVEKQTILRAIEKNNGNITKAAKELGITRTALYRRLSKYEI